MNNERIKIYKIYSAKDQGVFKKGELIGTLTEDIFNSMFIGCEYDKITTYGSNRVYLTREDEYKSEPHSLNPHPEKDHDGW